MQTTTVERGTNTTGFKLENLTGKATEAKMLVEDLVEIGKRKAQRLAKRSYAAGEDCLDETTHYIKHHPWQSVGIAVGLGIGLGFLTGMLSRRS